MSEGRGMKKWAPFASLVEQSIYLQEMHYQKFKGDKPLISKEKAEEINRILSNYKGQDLTITYFYDGYIYKITTAIKRIDTLNKKIIFNDGDMPFSQIIDIENSTFDDFDF